MFAKLAQCLSVFFAKQVEQPPACRVTQCLEYSVGVHRLPLRASINMQVNACMSRGEPVGRGARKSPSAIVASADPCQGTDKPLQHSHHIHRLDGCSLATLGERSDKA